MELRHRDNRHKTAPNSFYSSSSDENETQLRNNKQPAKKAPFIASIDVWVALFLIFLSLGIFYNGLEGQLCYDDHFAIKNNKDATAENPFAAMWYHDFWGQDISKQDSHKSYRPITVLTFRLNYLIHRQFFEHPSDGHRRFLIQLHLVNVVLHAIVSIQLFNLCRRMFSDQNDKLSLIASFIGSILFVTHPIHTEAITGLVGRAEPLSAIFSLLAFSLYRNGSQSGSLSQLLLSIMMYYLAILCKETSFPLVAILVLWDVLQNLGKPQKSFWKNIFPRKFFFRVGLLAFAAIGYLIFRRMLTVHFTVMNYRRVENPIAFGETVQTRFLSLLYLHARYMWLLFFPHPLSADYSYSCLPLIESITDYRNLAGFSLYASLGALALYLGRQLFWPTSPESSSHAKKLAVGILWLIFPFLPTSNFLVWVGTMLAERLLYLPSIGFCILVATTCDYIFKRHPKSKLYIGIVVLIVCLLFSIKTVQRNEDWLNEQRLFDSAELVCPDSAKVHHNQGIMAMDRKDWTKAKFHFARVREIEPRYCETDLQHGLIAWEDKKDPNEAVQWFKLATKCIYTQAKAAENLHSIYEALIKLFPENFFYFEQWAEILQGLERTDDAYHHYIQAGIGFEQRLQRSDDAARCFEAAVKVKGDEAFLAHLWLGTIKERKIDYVSSKNEAIEAVLSHYWKIITKSDKYRVYALSGAVGLLSKLGPEKRPYFAAYLQVASDLLKTVDMSALERPEFLSNQR